jgi:hypothetical protein
MDDELITAGMITAGNDAIAKYWVELRTSESAMSLVPAMVVEIFTAMRSAQRCNVSNYPHTFADSAS